MKPPRMLRLVLLSVMTLFLATSALAISSTITCCGWTFTIVCEGCTTASAGCNYTPDCSYVSFSGSCSGCDLPPGEEGGS